MPALRPQPPQHLDGAADRPHRVPTTPHRETTVNRTCNQPTHQPGRDQTTPGPRRLADFLPDGPAATTPAVPRTEGGIRVVVLRRSDPAPVEVWQSSQLLRLLDDTQASPITDPARRDDLVRRALRSLAEQRHAATQPVVAARGDRDRYQAEPERMLRDIRRYAIDRHRGGEVCREGLDAFGARFGLDPYQPRLRVARITGTVQVATDNRDTAEYQVPHYLAVDASAVDDAVEDSADIRVAVTAVEPVDD